MRYILCPGHVTSSSDGNVHFVTAHQLLDLYNIDDNVSVNDCVVMGRREYVTSQSLQDGDIVLRPKNDGDYSLPKPHRKTK